MAHEAFALQGRTTGGWDLKTLAFIALLLCGPMFVLAPQIDTRTAALFYKGHGGFAGNGFAIVALARNAFKLVYIVSCSVAVAGLLYTLATRSRFLGLTRLQHLFLITCLAAGPGLVTNVALKDHWGRARPREIVEFGGDKAFTPALTPAMQCRSNCSFVSGEAASMFMVFFAGALLLPTHAGALIIAGVATGFGAGAIRMSQGGHFLSDVVFSGILMAVTAVLIHWLFGCLASGTLSAREN